MEKENNLYGWNKSSFGAAIKSKREERKLSLRSLADQLGISAVFMGDIERGNRFAPNKESFLTKLFCILNVTPEEERELRTMILINRKDGVDDYLAKTPAAKIALRMADETGAPDTVWFEFMDRLRELNSTQESETE